MKYLCLLIAMMTTLVLIAADPVGRVTSSGPLVLNGKAVPATAGSSLPVVAGDEIVTSKSAAWISFGDHSRATIGPNSRIKLEAHISSVTVRVLSGSVDLSRANNSRISLIQPVQPVQAKPPVPPNPPRPPPPSPPPPPPPRSRSAPSA